ncbi:MAG: LysM peptidoglycan-binding domain-containing protein [Bacteroidota bacterium]
MYRISALLIIFVYFTSFSQENSASRDSVLQNSDSVKANKKVAISKIDTLRTDSLNVLEKKIAVIDYSLASEIDKKWMESWNSSVLNDTINSLIENDTIQEIVIEDLPTDTLKLRLAYLNSQSPFNVEYNPSLERIIKHYLKNRKKTLANLMGKAKYYFPLFEEHLDKYDMPVEIKYLAIVESALKPNAKSRVGAKGLWQFMYGTGKMYDLKVSSYVDERCDPIKSTEAACQYLTKLYDIFDDWDLALAAYNSGPGNVSKAIRRSGGRKNYWNIRQFLPRETAGYLPAFYATYYLFEYADAHNLSPKNELTHLFETDTITLKRQLTFDQINRVMQTDDELLEFLNPQYKLNIIPKIKDRDYTLRLPKYMVGTFVANEELIYAYASADDAKREKPMPKYFEANDRIRYRVRSGDYLGKIARRYGVSVSSIKRWNGLRSNNLRVGQRLTIYPRRAYASVPKKVNKSSSKTSGKKSTPKGKYATYVVKKGDSLWLISQKFPNVSVKQIKDWNNIWGSKYLKPGTRLKIY